MSILGQSVYFTHKYIEREGGRERERKTDLIELTKWRYNGDIIKENEQSFVLFKDEVVFFVSWFVFVCFIMLQTVNII